MKVLTTITLALASFFIGTAANATMDQPGSTGLVCLQGYLVDHTKVVDSSTVLFYMRGGKIWQNNLKAPCNGLKFHGFSVIGREMEICGRSGIRVIETQQVCQLGNFTAYNGK